MTVVDLDEFTRRLLGLAVVLGRYDAEGAHWSEVCAESEAENRAESYADAVAHGEALERLADEFATAARAVLDVQGIPSL